MAQGVFTQAAEHVSDCTWTPIGQRVQRSAMVAMAMEIAFPGGFLIQGAFDVGRVADARKTSATVQLTQEVDEPFSLRCQPTAERPFVCLPGERWLQVVVG